MGRDNVRTRPPGTQEPYVSTVKPLDEGETFSIGELRIVSRVQGGQSGGELELYERVLSSIITSVTPGRNALCHRRAGRI